MWQSIYYPAWVFTIWAVFVLLSGCTSSHQPDSELFITWDGLEPDKWASVWLIKRHIDPDAVVEIRPTHARTDDGIAFDVPGAKYMRDNTQSTFTTLVTAYSIEDSKALRIGKVIHDMDVNIWAGKELPETPMIENAIRTLQVNFQRKEIPVYCYLQLFDTSYEYLEKVDQLEIELLDTVNGCGKTQSNQIVDNRQSIVPTVAIDRILNMMNDGKRVVFVDTRESAEFNEAHIPNAINIKLREVNTDAAKNISSADLVISYCVKDFRGYEVARALKEVGVVNSAIMEPYGIKGWIANGLPVTGDDGLEQSEAIARMKQCVSDPGSCLEA